MSLNIPVTVEMLSNSLNSVFSLGFRFPIAVCISHNASHSPYRSKQPVYSGHIMREDEANFKLYKALYFQAHATF